MTILPPAAVNNRWFMRRQLTTAGVFQRQLTTAEGFQRCTVLFTIQPLFLHSFNTYFPHFFHIQPIFSTFFNIQPIFSTFNLFFHHSFNLFFLHFSPIKTLTFPHILSSLLSFPIILSSLLSFLLFLLQNVGLSSFAFH